SEPRLAITGHQSRGSRDHRWMIEPLASKPQTGVNILQFEVWQFFKHLLCGQAVGEQIEHIRHTDAHASDTWTSPTLLGVNGDTFRQLGHALSLLYKACCSVVLAPNEAVEKGDF